MNLSVDLTYTFDINTMSLKSISLQSKLGYNVNKPFKLEKIDFLIGYIYYNTAKSGILFQ